MNAQTFPSTDTPLQSPPPAPAPAVAPAARGPDTFSLRWLAESGETTWGREGQRLLVALALASAFGLAIGLHPGGARPGREALTLLLSSLGAPAGIAAVAGLAVPAFAIVLALVNAPVDVMDLARATSRGAMRAGLLLAGLAPGVAMLVVTCEDAITVSATGFIGLLLGGTLAARSFQATLRPQLEAAPRSTRAVLAVAMPLFILFAAVLAARVWWLALPALTEVA